MTRVPHRDFAVHWYITYALLVVCSLPLGYLGWVSWWPELTEAIMLLGLGIFIGVENLAKVARSMGYSGTKTSFTFWKIDDPSAPVWAAAVRSLVGLWMGLVILWRLPPGPQAFWGLGWIQVIFGGFFVTWLPYHLVWSKDGPWERLGRFLVRYPPLKWTKKLIDG